MSERTLKDILERMLEDMLEKMAKDMSKRFVFFCTGPFYFCFL